MFINDSSLFPMGQTQGMQDSSPMGFILDPQQANTDTSLGSAFNLNSALGFNSMPMMGSMGSSLMPMMGLQNFFNPMGGGMQNPLMSMMNPMGAMGGNNMGMGQQQGLFDPMGVTGNDDAGSAEGEEYDGEAVEGEEGYEEIEE